MSTALVFLFTQLWITPVPLAAAMAANDATSMSTSTAVAAARYRARLNTFFTCRSFLQPGGRVARDARCPFGGRVVRDSNRLMRLALEHAQARKSGGSAQMPRRD